MSWVGVFWGLVFLAWPGKVVLDCGGGSWLLDLSLVGSALLGAALAFRPRDLGPRPLDGWRLALCLLGIWHIGDVYARVGGDGVEHYILARSALFDRDLDLANDFAGMGATVVTREGHAISRVSAGVSLVWAPVLAVTHVFVTLAKGLGSSWPNDGFSQPYLSAATAASYAVAFAGLLVLDVVLRRAYSAALAFLTVVALWLATPLIFYMTANPAMSHATAAGVSAFFVALWLRARGGDDVRSWLLAGLGGGLLLLVRPHHFVVYAVPALEIVLRRRLAGARVLAAYLAGAVAAGLVQGLEWTLMYGLDFITIVPSQELVATGGAEVLRFLFSARHGLFTWTPVYFVAALGWLFWLRRDRWLGGLILLAFTLSVLLHASMGDWWSSDSFGQRRVLALTPLFAAGLAEVLRQLAARPLVLPALAVGGLILWNSGFAYIYNSELVARKSQAVSLDRLAAAQLDVAYRRLLRASWLPRPLFALLYDNLRGVWLDEGSNSLGGRLTLGREPEDFPQAVGNGWYEPEREGELTFRRSRAPQSWVVVPIDTVGAFEVVVHLRPEIEDLKVTLLANDRACGEVQTVPGWSDYTFSVPADALVSGLNAFGLRYSATPRQRQADRRAKNAAVSVHAFEFHRRDPLLRSYKE